MSNANVSLAYAYDTLNRITQVTNQTYNHAVNYTYDPAGNMATRSLVTDGLRAGSVTAKYAYDGKNRLTTITDPLTGVFRFNYDPMDRRTSLVYPNGASTFYTYDKAYRLSAMATKVAGGARRPSGDQRFVSSPSGPLIDAARSCPSSRCDCRPRRVLLRRLAIPAISLSS
jgi:YD repeat-containing protein